MANIEKNNKEENLENTKNSPTKNIKEKVSKLSWWAKLFLFCFFGFILLFSSLLIVINIPSVKNRMAEYAIDLLNNQFKTEFKTENVEINFFGDVVITGLTAKDHHNFEFLKAQKVVGHSDWLGLIFSSRDLRFQKLSVENLDLKVITYKGEEQDNFNLFIKKFDSPKDPKKSPFKFTSRIQIKDSKVSIVNENQGEDGKWLKAEKFNAYVSELKTVGPDVKIRFNNMSFVTERWGKKHFLETLSGDLAITKEKFAFTDLTLHTDHSLLQGDLIFNLHKETGWGDFNNKVAWDMVLKKGSYLHGYDISYFVKKWDNYQNYALVGTMTGPLNNFTLKNFMIKTNENTIQTPEIGFSGLFNGDFKIKSNQLLADFTYPSLKTSLPQFISQKMGGFANDFGKINYNGSADITKDKVIAKGDLKTGIGDAKINEFTLSEYSSAFPKYEGNIVLNNLDIKAITKKNEVGRISGNFNISGKGFDLNTLSLKAKSEITHLELLGKTIQNIHLDGDLTAKKFNGIVKVADKFINGELNGVVDFSQPKLLADVKGNINHLDLTYLGLSKEVAAFKGNVDAKLSMTNVSDLVLDAQLNNVLVNKGKTISIPHGAVKLAFEEGERMINVDMPNVIKGKLKGKFDLENIGGMFQEAVGKVFVGNNVKKYYKNQNFVMDFDVHQDLVDYFAPDVHIPEGAKVKGAFFGTTNDFVFDVQASTVKYIMTKKEEISEADRLLAQANPEYIVREEVKKDSVMVREIALKINTSHPKEYWSANVGRVEYQGSLLKDIHINAENRGDKLHIATNLQVGTLEKEKNNQMVGYAANIDQSVNEQGDYVFRFDPTRLKISKFHWMVDTSPELNHSITYRRKNGDFMIQNLKLYSDDSELMLNGIFRNGKDFDLAGTLKNVDISKIWAIAHQDSKVDFQGIANGDLKLKMSETQLEPDIDININDIKINNSEIGDLVIDAESSEVKNVYNINTKIKGSELFGSEKLTLKGTIDNNTKSPTLALKANLNKFNLAFVQAFVKDIFTNFRGNATGEIEIDGTLKDINYGGDIAVNNFGLKLNFSGVDYTFDDTVVTLSNGNMLFNLVGVKDSRTNSKGTISIGRLSLSDLSNIGADLLIRSEDLQILDTTQNDFDIFWGKIYAKGDLFVGFGDNTLKLDAKADILQNSVFSLNSNSSSSVDEFKMLRFLEVNKEGNITVAEKQRSGVALSINLDITADKNSTVNVLVGEEVGDISVRGTTENMKFSMDKTGNMSMFGQYFVDSGTYVSKAILEKIFQIQKGSNLRWSGDAMNPDLDITATYRALVSNASEYLGVGSLPAINVQLQTKITNKLTAPDIKPAIVASEVSSQIREVMATKLATEEEKILQFASILALGNFNVSNTNASSAIGSGVNVFFKQLTSAFNSISDDFQIDLDYIKGSEHTNIGDRAATSLNYKVSPRLKIKTVLGVPISNNANAQNNYLSGEGMIEYDWSKTIDGSKLFRVYSKPSNVGLVSGANAGANQSYGGGVVISYEFDRIFRRKKKVKKEKTQQVKKDTIIQDSMKVK